MSIDTVQTKTFKIGDHEVSFETGKLAKSSSGSVVVRCGETFILVNATGSSKPRPGIDFFPLLCDYEEKMYSVGRLPGGFLKREGRPSEKATLTCRLLDRPIRPLWPDGYRNDVQVVAQPMSIDNVNQTDVLAILGASMALELSGLPFGGPIGAVRIGRVDGQFIVNPTFEQSKEGYFDLVVSGTADSIMMVEAGCNFVSEDELISALELAHEEIRKQVKVQEEFRVQCGVTKKEFVPDLDTKPMLNFVAEQSEKDIIAAYHNFDRDQRKEALDATKEKAKAALEALAEDHEISKLKASTELDLFGDAFKKVEKRVMRAMIVDEGVRADGRKADEIRPITCEVGIIPRAHGSGLFTRGSTQVLSILTLGSPGDAQKLDGVDPETEKRWLHHYAFPAYSVGEVRPMRGAGRREIGHGALAGRAIEPGLPPKEDFSYTLRVNSEVLESNGSTSMASTCGTSLAMMDGGVPLKEHIGGIAMGLIKEGDKTVVLSDIQGIEDFLGDMDFKVTGTKDGVSALQMDIKIQGISIDIMKKALEQAKVGRLHIIDKMNATIDKPRAELSKYAPRIINIRIDKEFIGAVIGPGGKTIRGIFEETGVQIDIEEDGLIEQLTLKVERGMISVGKVVRVIPIGAFVELAPGKDGLVHISQLANYRVAKVEDVVNVDDKVVVKVVEVDDRGRINLTIKGVTDEERGQHGFPPAAAAPNREPAAH